MRGARLSAALRRVDQRTTGVLQLLGRLEFVPVALIHALIFPEQNRKTVYLTLQRLHDQRLVWQSVVPETKTPDSLRAAGGKLPPRSPAIYGLTAQGRDWLAARDLEEDPGVVEHFIVRDWRAPEVRAAQLAHDLILVDWCCRAIQYLRRHPRVRVIRCLPEYVSATAVSGQPMQRFDALLSVGLGEPLAHDPDGPPIPWGLPDPREMSVVTWAVEVDRGTEKLVTLLGKAVMYRDLTSSGHYRATLGVNPLPVLLAPTPRRAAQIAREWFHGWPGGRGVIAPFAAARNSPYGVLWGRYKTLGENPARDATLWGDIGLTRSQWEADLTG